MSTGAPPGLLVETSTTTSTEHPLTLLPADHGHATLVLVGRARQSLLEARDVRDLRVAMEMAANAEDGLRRRAKLAEAEGMAAEIVREAEGAANDAAAIRIEAQALAGQALREMKERGERHAGHGDQRSELRAVTSKLADLGVSKAESSRWQKIAEVPVERRRAYVDETKAEGGEVTTSGLINSYLQRPTPEGDLWRPGASSERPRPRERPRVYKQYLNACKRLLRLRPEAVVGGVAASMVRPDLARIRAWCDRVEGELVRAESPGSQPF